MNIEALIPKLRTAFSTCEPLPIGMDMVRCERNYKDHPRSVYFFRPTSTLPDAQELERIHQEVVSPSYFKAQDAARWNHYVVFVADDGNKQSSNFRHLQRKIEEDKNYARKLVIYESELDSFIDHSVIQAEPDAPAQFIMNTWTALLEGSGLSQIQSQEARAPVIRAIRSGQTTSVSSTIKPKTVTAASSTRADLQSIKAFHIKQFGKREISGEFRFSRVNLIRGSNGSGKTSLLEAIEHYFCGATYRSNGNTEGLDAPLTFTNGKTVPYKSFTVAEYKEKDQRWYGNQVGRDNRLCNGFSRFNFLNTDAAVEFSNNGSLQNLKDALSKVALGPDAAYVWNRITAFEQDIRKELVPLDTTIANLDRQLITANARYAALQTASPQTEVQISIVNDSIALLGLTTQRVPETAPNAEWFAQFTSIRDFVEATNILDEVQSTEDLAQGAAELIDDLGLITNIQIKSRENSQQELDFRKKRTLLEEMHKLLLRTQLYLSSGFPEVCDAESKVNATRIEISKRLIQPEDSSEFLSLSTEMGCLDKPLAGFQDECTKKLTIARQNLQDTR